MTKREKVQYLKRYLDCEPDIIQLQEEIQRWRSVAERSAPSKASPENDRLQAAVDKITELEGWLAVKLEEAMRARADVETAISLVKDQRSQSILRFKFIEGWTLEKTAEAMGKSTRTVYRWYDRAISALTLNVSMSA